MHALSPPTQFKPTGGTAVGIPLECYNLGTYVQQLAFTMAVPIVLAAMLTLDVLHDPTTAQAVW